MGVVDVRKVWARAVLGGSVGADGNGGVVRADVVVLTALEVEYRAVRAHLEDPRPVPAERGAVFELGVFREGAGERTVAIHMTGPGNPGAGVSVERAAALFAPRAVLFVGVAGGVKDVALGDVVAADAVYDYETGKDTESGFLPRQKTYRSAYGLVQLARLVAAGDAWQRRIRPGGDAPRPRAHVKPLAAGGRVVAHHRSDVGLRLAASAGDALAVDMEGFGFLAGAYVNQHLDALVIRGISDLLGDKGEAHDERWQPVASRNAAAFAFELIGRIPAADAPRVEDTLTVRPLAAEAGSGPAPQALAALPPAPDLIGRTAHTDELLAALVPGGPGPGMVVVCGLAGIGKTALALHTAHQVVTSGFFPGGTLFVTLRGYTPAGAVSAGQALESLLRALGIRDHDLPPTVEEQAGLYQSELARRAEEHGPVLVVADDVCATGQVLPLVPAHPGHRLLATSRDTLTAPDLPARLIPLDQLAPQPAAALITSTLTRTRPGDPRPGKEPQALKQVTEQCGHLPLALTIAAAQLADDPGLPIATLADDLADARTRLEALHHHDGNGRSLAVRAAFELSYRRLEDRHALLFRLLALNPGPDLATEAAAALSVQSARLTRESLAALARTGLISEVPVGSGRWRMHDLVSLYAADLNQHHDNGQVLQRLLDHYQTTTQAANAHLGALPGQPVPERFPDRTAALAWLDAERPNLTAAVRLAATTGHPHTTVSLGLYLAPYLHQGRYFQDAITTGRHVLTTVRELGDRHSEGQALNNLAITLRRVRRFEEAITIHTQDLVICRELGDRHGEGAALNNLGIALRGVRRFEEAIAAHTQAADIFRDLGDRHGEGAALNNLGLALGEVRRFEEAITAHTQDLVICRELGDRHGEGAALNNLGLALGEVRRFEEAIAAHTQAADIARELGDRHSEGQALNNLGIALRGVRRFEEAIATHTQAADIARELGDRHSEGQALNNLGITLGEVRRFEEAITAHTQAADIFRDLGDRQRESTALNNLGITLRRARRFRVLRNLWRKLTR
ncbi:tetratricopeptide repeat protein [Streptomyces antimycoticus]|uniref:tetratricopeptide repeat protein n=1 Tax=Streptomyces antimycoticus TaxID=68175 RepID=UPI0033F38D83